jgi:hypothetical protein
VRDITYYESWKEIALRIVEDGIGLSASDLKAISDNLKFGEMKTDCHPPASLAEKSNPKRRTIQLEYLRRLYKCEPERWLLQEKEWLQNQRDRVGLTLEDGKDGLDDIVSSGIICEIIAAAYLVWRIEKGEYGEDPKSNDLLIRLALRSVNQVLENSVLKGYARCLRLDTIKSDDTGYSLLLSAGVLVGAAGKYLPDPENTLWRLLVLLHKDSIHEDSYV